MIINALFNSQFGYCLLIWIFDSRMANNKINKLHWWCLRINYSNKSLSYEEPLEKVTFVSLHHRNLHILTTEMFKVVRNIFPEIMKEIFHFYSQNNISLRQEPTLYSWRISLWWKLTCFPGTENMGIGSNWNKKFKLTYWI